jgi:transmembrane sensor
MNISEQQFRELLDRYLNNTANGQEREMLDRFFDSYKARANDPVLLQNDPDLQREILRNIHSRIAAKQNPPAKKPFLTLWLPLAAVISVFVLAYFFVDEISLQGTAGPVAPVVEENTARGQKLLIQLSDGTRVHLNGDTKISYPREFGESSREVNVAGEAYFEVVSDSKPFLVHANHMKTEVLGTSFNVKSRQGENAEVTLVEGKVKIFSPSGKSALLMPDQQAVVGLNSGDITTREVNVLRYTSWKDGVLFFEQTTLKEAITVLENWYDVKIDIVNSALEQCVITAKYQNEPLGNVLSSFQFLLNLEITPLHEGRFSISGKGCK